MGAIAELELADLDIEPGTDASTSLRVRNVGEVVDEFTFEAIGDAAGWISVEPAELRLFPNAEQTVTVRFTPPRSPDAAAGNTPFGVRVASKEDPEASVVEEGTLHVAPFADIFGELVPRVSKGRRKGTHDLALDNRSNHPVRAELIGYDQEEALDVELDPVELQVQPGTAAFANVAARPRARHWRGPGRSHAFQVEVRPDGAPPVVVDGTMVQDPIIPNWLPRAAALLLVVGLGLVALWFAFLRPSIESAAREAVEEPFQELAAENAAQNEAIEQAQGQAGAADAKADQALESVGESPSPTIVDEDPEPEFEREAFDVRLATADSPGGTVARADLEMEDDQTLELTDVLLENPRGHTGLVRIRRGTDTLITVALENFRSLDYHFVSPVTFRPGDILRLEIDCEEPRAGDSTCDAAGYFSGVMITEVTEATEETAETAGT